MSVVTRRRFLTSTAMAGAGVGAVALSKGPAAAFEIRPMDAKTHEAYLNACGSPEQRAYHQQLLAETKTKLAGTMSEADIDAAVAQLTCPICFCHLVG